MSGGEEARILAVFAKPTMGWVEFCAVTIEPLVNPVADLVPNITSIALHIVGVSYLEVVLIS